MRAGCEEFEAEANALLDAINELFIIYNVIADIEDDEEAAKEFLAAKGEFQAKRESLEALQARAEEFLEKAEYMQFVIGDLEGYQADADALDEWCVTYEDLQSQLARRKVQIDDVLAKIVKFEGYRAMGQKELHAKRTGLLEQGEFEERGVTPNTNGQTVIRNASEDGLTRLLQMIEFQQDANERLYKTPSARTRKLRRQARETQRPQVGLLERTPVTI